MSGKPTNGSGVVEALSDKIGKSKSKFVTSSSGNPRILLIVLQDQVSAGDNPYLLRAIGKPLPHYGRWGVNSPSSQGTEFDGFQSQEGPIRVFLDAYRQAAGRNHWKLGTMLTQLEYYVDAATATVLKDVIREVKLNDTWEMIKRRLEMQCWAQSHPPS